MRNVMCFHWAIAKHVLIAGRRGGGSEFDGDATIRWQCLQ